MLQCKSSGQWMRVTFPSVEPPMYTVPITMLQSKSSGAHTHRPAQLISINEVHDDDPQVIDRNTVGNVDGSNWMRVTFPSVKPPPYIIPITMLINVDKSN